jgi:hypothetical protein
MNKDQAMALVDEAKRCNVKISEKEHGLIQTILRYNPMHQLSSKQQTWIENIYARATGGGQYVSKTNGC